MEKEFNRLQEDYNDIIENLSSVVQEDTIWVAPLYPIPKKNQGIKLHISATLFSAKEILIKILPILHNYNFYFKVAKSLIELKKLNCGLFYGISQMGKFITIYCDTDCENTIHQLAEILHKTTLGCDYVNIPYDLQYKKNSCIFYRYGSFVNNEITIGKKKISAIINKSNGRLEEDKRSYGKQIPRWYKNSLPSYKDIDYKFDNYVFYKTISQRGKGGVYMAIKTNSSIFINVIIKEGRKNGEIDIDKTDGYGKILEEYNFLVSGLLNEISPPKIIEYFELSNNNYLVLEKIVGEDIQSYLFKNKINLFNKLNIMIKIVRIIIKIHSKKIIWRDIKPSNLMLTNNYNVRPIDFEGMVYQGSEVYNYGSEGFIAPEANKITYLAETKNDIYSLGSTFFFILTNCFLKQDKSNINEIAKKRIPLELKNLVIKCLSENRCDAVYIEKVLKQIRLTMRSTPTPNSFRQRLLDNREPA